jgi:hypothetical protein
MKWDLELYSVGIFENEIFLNIQHTLDGNVYIFCKDDIAVLKFASRVFDKLSKALETKPLEQINVDVVLDTLLYDRNFVNSVYIK